jgi:hypothetical protein
MAREGEQPDDLDVSIRWPKGYHDEDPPPRRRRRSADGEGSTRRRARTPVAAPAATADEAIEVPPVDAAPAADPAVPEGDAGLAERVDHVSRQLAAVTARITEALDTSAKAVRRVEQLASALSVEVAEIGQAITDEIAGYSSVTTDEVRSRAKSISTEVARVDKSITQQLEGLAAAVADSYDRPGGGSSEGVEEVLETTSEAVGRVEMLVEALVEASDARPTEISEFTAKTLERLGLTVGARFEASTTTAVEAIDAAVDEAVDRAVTQFKEVAPPLVDRSATAAITRLEERIAELTRQRADHDQETKATLDALEETVGRLASAQAEDFERVVDTIENAPPQPSPTASADEERLDRIEKAVADLAGTPPNPPGLDDVAGQIDAINKQLAALRRRLPVRGRAGTGGLDDRALNELAALIAARIGAPAAVPPAAPPRVPRTPRPATQASRPARPTKAATSKTTPSRVRRRPTGE